MASDSSSTITLSASGHRVRTYRWRYLQLIKDGLIWLTGKRTRNPRISDSTRSVPESGKIMGSRANHNHSSNKKVLRFKQIRTRSHPSRGKSGSTGRRHHSKGGAWNRRGRKAFTRRGRKKAKMRKPGAGKRQTSARPKSYSRKRNPTFFDMTKHGKARAVKPRLRHTSATRPQSAGRPEKPWLARRQESDERDLKRRWTSSQDLLIPIRHKTKSGKLQKRSGPSDSIVSVTSRYCLASVPVTPTVSGKGHTAMGKSKRSRLPSRGRRMTTRSMTRLARAGSVPSGSASTAVICVTRSRSSNSELYD